MLLLIWIAGAGTRLLWQSCRGLDHWHCSEVSRNVGHSNRSSRGSSHWDKGHHWRDRECLVSNWLRLVGTAKIGLRCSFSQGLSGLLDGGLLSNFTPQVAVFFTDSQEPARWVLVFPLLDHVQCYLCLFVPSCCCILRLERFDQHPELYIAWVPCGMASPENQKLKENQGKYRSKLAALTEGASLG